MQARIVDASPERFTQDAVDAAVKQYILTVQLQASLELASDVLQAMVTKLPNEGMTAYLEQTATHD